MANSRRPTAPLAAAATETERAPRSAPARGWVRGALCWKPGLPRPVSALGVRQRPPHRPDLHPPRPWLPHLGREPAAADGVARLSASWGSREAGPGTAGSPATDYVTGRGRSRDREGGPAALPPLVRCRRRSQKDHWSLRHVAPPSLTTTPPSWERASLRPLAGPTPEATRTGCGSSSPLRAAQPPLRACVDAGGGPRFLRFPRSSRSEEPGGLPVLETHDCAAGLLFLGWRLVEPALVARSPDSMAPPRARADNHRRVVLSYHCSGQVTVAFRAG